MNESQALQNMVPPGARKPGKWLQGVIQIWVTRACDKSCFNCTQFSNLGGNPGMITLENFEKACIRLKDYHGVVGVFGGNPAMHPKFEELCAIMEKHIPFHRRGLWCNNPLGKGAVMRRTFNPRHSNLNVHLDQEAYDEFKRWWPESSPCGLESDSRHAPAGGVALRDLTDMTDDQRWELIGQCDINRHWSGMFGQFRGELRFWFCEIAGAQAMLHQTDPNYPDTGFSETYTANGKICWNLPMQDYAHQVRKHCMDCGVPLRGYGELAQSPTGVEQCTETHADFFKPKTRDRLVQLVTTSEQTKPLTLGNMVSYLENSTK